ncbi:MAG: hypothetical protein ACREKL_13250 [Chthoniobacterales bacterium]
MAIRWFLALAGFLAVETELRAEFVISSIVKEGDTLPGQLAGETYTVTSVAEARAQGGGTVYFWAKGDSSIALAGTKEGLWSYSGGTFTCVLLESNGVPNAGSAMRIANPIANTGAIRQFSLNPGGFVVSVGLTGGGVNANTDRAIIYRKDGVNYLIQQSATADTELFPGVSLKANAIVYSLLRLQQVPEVNTLYSSIVNAGMPQVYMLAIAPGAVVGEAGSNYKTLRGVTMDASGNNAYRARITDNAAQTTNRVGVSDGAAYAFPVGQGTALDGTGGALELAAVNYVLPSPAGGWWLAGPIQANGGALVDIELPLSFSNGTLTSLFPGGVLAALFGTGGSSRGISSFGAGMDGSLAMEIQFEDDDGNIRNALLRRDPGGSWKLIGEEGRVIVVDGVAHALTSTSSTSQPFTADGTLFFKAILDGNVSAILTVRTTSAAPEVQIAGRARRMTNHRRLVVRGTASDDGTVRQVNYQLNRKAPRAAAGTTTWQFTARLNPGRNRIVVRAVDGDGGSSRPARVMIVRRAR